MADPYEPLSDAVDFVALAPQSIPHDRMVSGLLASSRIRPDPIVASKPTHAANPDPWAAGVARLQAIAPLPEFTPTRWRRVQTDCAALLDQRGAEMRRFGWSAEDAFGIHPTAPWAAIHCYGLGPLLAGGKVADLTAVGWVNARSAFFNMQSWARCYDPELRMEDLAGRRCVIGMDLASKFDIAALQIVIELDDGRVATFGRYYLPGDAVDGPGKDHYRGWAFANPFRLTLTEGNMIDFERIEEDLDALRQRFTVDVIAFDPSQATMLMTRLAAKGVTVQQFDQNARNYSEPMKQLAAMIEAGKLLHDCDDRHPMTWMMSNVTARVDAKEQVYHRKERPEAKIDGPVALIMAIARWMGQGAQPEPESRYNNPQTREIYFTRI